MKTNRMLLFVMFLGALFAREAQAFYNPSAGRWLSRDPLGDESFLSRYGSDKPEADARLHEESVMPTYVFTANGGANRVDPQGLQDTDWDIVWTPSPMSCRQGESVAFVQIGYGGWGSYKEPFVDDGSAGYGASSTGCPEYPNFGAPGTFQDSPRGATGPVQFIVCQVCTEPMCCKGTSGRRMTQIVKCIKWKKGDTGSMPYGFTQADMREILLVRETINKKYPGICYACNHKAIYK